MPNKNGKFPAFVYSSQSYISTVLSNEFVENAVQLLVSRFMPLKPDDLENWLSDPEDWFNLEEKESDQWEYEIRVCMYSITAFPA